jgi:regulator of protease activity HflC (stomatin/prohibitin superfamily)
MGCVQCIEQDQMGVVTQCGKFTHVQPAGLVFLPVPCVCEIQGTVTTRVQHLEVRVESKTKDNVFVNIDVAVQFRVMPEKVYEAFYRLQNIHGQINAYIFDVIRAEIPKMTVDECFANRDGISKEVKLALQKTFDTLGYEIVAVLIKQVDPDREVKDAMNEINKQKRERLATEERAEAEKMLTVKIAEGEARAKELHGQGVARQRAAVVDGLKESVASFSEAGSSAKDVLELVLCNQYFDTMRDVGSSTKNNCVFLHSSGIAQ